MTRDELIAFIDEKVSQEHDYNTSADALWEVAEAAFNYVASELGVTGFQAGYASMMLLKKTKGLDCPVAVIHGDDLLYPQYDIPAKVAEWIEGWKPWAGEQARKLLAKSDPEHVHPDVWRRWEELALIPAEVQHNDGTGSAT